MGKASIKGAAITRIREQLEEAMEKGLITRDEIEVRLHAEDMFVVEEKIEPSLWYPLDSVARASDILVETLGAGDIRFMVDSGRETARRFQNEGIFAAFIQDAAMRGDKMGPVLVKISQLALDIGRWEFEGESMRDFTVTVGDAADLPETTRYSILGFIECLASDLAGTPLHAETTRPDPSNVLYRCAAKNSG